MIDVKRKGETFAEFLTAAAVFGVMMVGVVEFMANQTDNLAKVRHMDDMMYHAQLYRMTPTDSIPPVSDKGITYEEKDGNTLIVKKNGNTTMTLKFKP
ncbi:MAG: hypothetical protein IJR27_00305 [Synergistaceae bacterium]|nr:hypothetical protein [Synergistaceae bacterium]